MDKKEAIEFLKGSLRRIPALAKLNYDNSEYPLWRDTITEILEAVFGQNSIEYKEFKRSGRLAHIHTAFDAFTNIHQEDYITNLKGLETAILSIIKKHELLGIETKPSSTKEPKDTAELPVNLFDKMRFHPRVVEASKSCFVAGNYREAILNAFIRLIDYVKEITGLDLDGDDLMNKVFSLNYDKDLGRITKYPIIRINELKNSNDRNEQQGFMFLCKGAAGGIRNPKAHKLIPQSNPLHTLEYLAFASLLMRRIEEGKLVRLSK